MRRPPAGLFALSIFFAFGALMAGVAGVALLFPADVVEPIWTLNPEAGVALRSIGLWAVALMFVVTGAGALTAFGLWTRAPWGRRLALVVVAVNLAGDGVNALVRGDLRTLIGIPIAGALIAYLLSARVRRAFATTDTVA